MVPAGVVATAKWYFSRRPDKLSQSGKNRAGRTALFSLTAVLELTIGAGPGVPGPRHAAGDRDADRPGPRITGPGCLAAGAAR